MPRRNQPGCPCCSACLVCNNTVCPVPVYELQLAVGANKYLIVPFASGNGYTWQYGISGNVLYQFICNSQLGAALYFVVYDGNGNSICSNFGGGGLTLTSHTCPPNNPFSVTFTGTAAGPCKGVTYTITDPQFTPALCCSPCAIPKQDLAFTATTTAGNIPGTLTYGKTKWDSGIVTISEQGQGQAVQFILDCETNFSSSLYNGQQTLFLTTNYFQGGILTATCKVDAHTLSAFTCGPAFSLTWVPGGGQGPACAKVNTIVSRLVITL
jgi:hypothetical protein